MNLLQAQYDGQGWCVRAPSNIAWIKYMGKVDATTNVPCNSSLSYTIMRYQSDVRVSLRSEGPDDWQPLEPSFSLTAKEQQRFLSHAAWLKEQLGLDASLQITSGNNFAKNCGMASSAASFAALTVAIVAASGRTVPYEQMAMWARSGSGSACRSFYAPWVLWSPTELKMLSLPSSFTHQALIISMDKKSVSSSEAHLRVLETGAFADRMARAEARLLQLVAALHARSWSVVYRLVWDEFMDMHDLFSSAGFSYWSPKTEGALALIDRHWQKYGMGPIVTMDAGPNIHCFWIEGHDDAGLSEALTAYGVWQ